jgi:hypothetical protein
MRVLALGYVLFVIYGSLVPLAFRPIPLAVAIDHFTRVVTGPCHRFPNGLRDQLSPVRAVWLFVAGRAAHRSAGWFGSLLAAVFTIGCGFVLCSAIEFTQTFFPGRTVALSDVIAETSGGVFGATGWLLVGPAVTGWLRAFSKERERPALLQRLLLAHDRVPLQPVAPLDLTLSLGELARKYRQGRITLHPFGFVHTSWLSATWDYSGRGSTRRSARRLPPVDAGRSRRRARWPSCLASWPLAAIELAQFSSTRATPM